VASAPTLDVPGFLRLHGARAPALMWFLGAGASAAAGVPTAGQMIWDFKRTIFCSEERVPLAACQYIDDQQVRDRIQRHFGNGGHPAVDDPEEYAHYFELAYPDELDRRRYIEAKVKGSTPSFGHAALAMLMAADRARVVWSTNFDACVETSATQIFGSAGNLTVASLDNPTFAEQALKEERWPLQVKLHGDFRSRRLKNTDDELRSQDARLRDALGEASRRYGLIVIGYSGRDSSVMDALEAAAIQGGYPAGLFWIHRDDTPPLPRVQALITTAASVGIDAAIVHAETFDELLGDVLRQTPDMPEELLKAAEVVAPRLGRAPIPTAGNAWPVIRTNALPVVEFPSTCRLVESTIGGIKDLRAAVKAADVGETVLVTRTRAGVLAFGEDAALRSALVSHPVTRTDLHPIDASRLGWDSGEHGLLAEALTHALARERPLLVRRRRHQWVLVTDPKQQQHDAIAPVRAVTRSLVGTLPTGSGHWAEAVALRLDWRLDRLWLLVEPIIWLTRSDGPRPAKDMDFVRERRAKRYNQQSDELLAAWIGVLLGGESLRRVTAFGGVDGVDAAFVISETTAFSRRATAISAQRSRAA
jgi:SIR2-like domain